MSKIKLVAVLLTWVTYSYSRQTNYCDPSLCMGHAYHIACNNSQHFAKTCESPKLIYMSRKLKQIIVNEHNRYRNAIASGVFKKFQPASKMLTLKWNEELAYFARLNVFQCRMHHDNCRNTAKYKFCGQNLGKQPYTLKINTQQTVKELIEAWYKENVKTPMTDIKTFRGYNLEKIGHFTAMIQDRASEVGCAVAEYKAGQFKNILLACDYSFTNVIGFPVYKSGRSCTKCRTGCSKRYKSLCSPHEPADPYP